MTRSPEPRFRQFESKKIGTNDPSLRRGWLYRALAPDPAKRVFAFAAPFASRWFPDVVQDAPRTEVREACGLVIFHATLGEFDSLNAALRWAYVALEPGGVLALTGRNRVRAPWFTRRAERGPRSTLHGYRRAAERAGFKEVDVFGARPDDDDYTVVFSTAPACAHAFYAFEVERQTAAGIGRWLGLRRRIAASWLSPWMESAYVVVGRKC